jgi:hypothetical protein
MEIRESNYKDEEAIDSTMPVSRVSGGNEAIQQQHEQLNLLMSRLDEQQRRWLAALEAKRVGHGGSQQVSEITGLDITQETRVVPVSGFVKVCFDDCSNNKTTRSKRIAKR